MEKQFYLLPERASTIAPRIDALFWFIFAVCAFFAVLIAVLLIFFAIRYRRVSEDYFPTPLVGSKALELVWTGIPLVLVLVMARQLAREESGTAPVAGPDGRDGAPATPPRPVRARKVRIWDEEDE